MSPVSIGHLTRRRSLCSRKRLPESRSWAKACLFVIIHILNNSREQPNTGSRSTGCCHSWFSPRAWSVASNLPIIPPTCPDFAWWAKWPGSRCGSGGYSSPFEWWPAGEDLRDDSHVRWRLSKTTCTQSRNDSEPNDARLRRGRSIVNVHLQTHSWRPHSRWRWTWSSQSQAFPVWGDLSVTHWCEELLDNSLRMPSWKEEAPNTTDCRLGKSDHHPTLSSTTHQIHWSRIEVVALLIQIAHF